MLVIPRSPRNGSDPLTVPWAPFFSAGVGSFGRPPEGFP